MKNRPVLGGILLAALCCADEAWSHGGGLDAKGCHRNSKTGDYHCHRGPSAAAVRADMAPAQFAPAKATSVERSTPQRAYANCAEARAAGAAPVRRGEPGYGPHLDRDNDGVGCEPYRPRQLSRSSASHQGDR